MWDGGPIVTSSTGAQSKIVKHPPGFSSREGKITGTCTYIDENLSGPRPDALQDFFRRQLRSPFVALKMLPFIWIELMHQPDPSISFASHGRRRSACIVNSNRVPIPDLALALGREGF